MGFYENFTRLCVKKGISETTACNIIGISPSARARWMKGSIPHGTTLVKIADFFGVQMGDLLKDEIKERDVILTSEEASLLSAWGKATKEQKENIAFILRETGFKLAGEK